MDRRLEIIQLQSVKCSDQNLHLDHGHKNQARLKGIHHSCMIPDSEQLHREQVDCRNNMGSVDLQFLPSMNSDKPFHHSSIKRNMGNHSKPGNSVHTL